MGRQYSSPTFREGPEACASGIILLCDASIIVPALSLRVRMKKGDVEVEVSGSEKEVSNTFENIGKLAEKFLGAFSVVRESRRDLPLSDTGENAELNPSVQA